jgi:hypothetical protein
MSEESAANQKKIYDLTEIYEERNGRNNQEVILIDGRGYEKISKDIKFIHELVDIAEDQTAGKVLQEEIAERISSITEKIARELIAEIAERVIREEIEKLKKISEN